MEPIRILIADDDPGMRQVLGLLIDRAEGCRLVGAAENGEQLLELYDRLRPEVVFMDVEMPGLSGIECAKQIQDRDPRTVLVFATAHEQYMRNAFEVYAFDYLVKPFHNERVLQTLGLIRQRLRGERAPGPLPGALAQGAAGKLVLRHRSGMSFLDFADILLIQREDRATAIYLKGEARYVTSDGLQELEDRLPREMFFRSHKSYIINLNAIESIEPYGRWTFIVKLKGTKLDALITSEKLEELEKRFGG